MSDPADDTWVLEGADARLDVDRARRTGDPEVVYGEGKTPEQIVEILGALHDPERAKSSSPGDPAAIAAVTVAHPRPTSTGWSYRRAARTRSRTAASWSAGTSDLPVAREAMVTLARTVPRPRLCDVGVAGLHRILAVRDRMDANDSVIVVAGMEGALATVVGA